MASKVPTEESGVSNPCQDPQTRAPELERRNRIASGSKNKQLLCLLERGENLLESQVLSSLGPMHGLALGHSCRALMEERRFRAYRSHREKI